MPWEGAPGGVDAVAGTRVSRVKRASSELLGMLLIGMLELWW